MINTQLNKGDIWYVDLEPIIGHEQGKKRPCLIISIQEFNAGPGELVVIIPITSRYRAISWFVPIPQSVGILKNASFIICNQIRTVSHKRLSGHCLGRLPDVIFDQVKRRVKILLDL